jgi:hypothetical protein
MVTQLVEIKDFPGMTLDDALKIGVHRLTQHGYDQVEALPGQPEAAERGSWRLAFRVADPPLNE